MIKLSDFQGLEIFNIRWTDQPESTQQQCENPVAQQYQLGLELGVTGTPALLTSDGNLIPGYVPPESLRARLDSMAASAAD